MPSRKRGKRITAAVKGSHLEAPPEFLRELAKRELHLAEARRDVNRFIEYILERPDGRPAKQGRIHREWQKLCDDNLRTMIVAPRLHWKTGQMLARAMFKLGRDVNEIIKIVCQSDKKAIKRLFEVRKHCKDNDSLHRVFPNLHIDRAEEWNKHMITFRRRRTSPDPSIEALGITSSASGDRATGILADDVVDRRNAITLPKVRESIKTSWDDWDNLLPPDGWLWYICTLWHRGDLSHLLMKNPEYAVAIYRITMPGYGSEVTLPGGIHRHSDEPLWGSADEGPWSRANLTRKRRGMTARQFARSFSNRPAAEDELRIKPQWFHYYSSPPTKAWQLVVSLDLASAQSKQSDYTGVCVLAVNPDKPQIKVVDGFRLKLTFPDKVRLVRWIKRRYRPAYIVVELTAGGRELREFMIDEYGIVLYGMKPRHGKMARLDKATPYMERGQILFSAMLNPKREHSEDRGCLITELSDAPLGDTDDILDAYSQGVIFITAVFEQFGNDDDDDYDYDDDEDELEDADDSAHDSAESSVLLV